MQKKIIKRVLIIIILFMIITWAYKIMKTYALFYSEVEEYQKGMLLGPFI